MSTAKQKDNSTFKHKMELRRLALERCRALADPVILETHGGEGKLFGACYADVVAGAVFEKDPGKVDVLAKQRPTWSVYEGCCETPLAQGAADHLRFNFLDVDPYGSPFPVLESIFGSKRPLGDTVQLVVNDGLRQKVQLGGAWSVDCLKPIVEEYGNDLYGDYLQVAKEMVKRTAAKAGYALKSWRGYYCGAAAGMTHYWAELAR